MTVEMLEAAVLAVGILVVTLLIAAVFVTIGYLFFRIVFDGMRAVSFMRCQSRLCLKKRGRRWYKGMIRDFFWNWWTLLFSPIGSHSQGNTDWSWHDIGRWKVDGWAREKGKMKRFDVR